MNPTILIEYFLSPAGQRNALAAGQNANQTQHIVLRAPNYVEAPNVSDSDVEALQGVGGKLDIPHVVDVFLQCVRANATPQNVVVEQASQDVWDKAVALSVIAANGQARVLINVDDSGTGHFEGYTVVWDSNRVKAVVNPDVSYDQWDGPQDAATLVAFETLRRQVHDAAYEQATQEAQTLRETKIKEYKAERLQEAVDAACGFLRQNVAWRHLPEVVELQAIVDDKSRVGELVNDPPSRGDGHPQSNASAAILKAEKQAARDAKADWIRQHGSEHARRLLEDMDLIDDAQYRNERLAIERPGFRFAIPHYSSDFIPSLTDLELLNAARKIDPTAKLRQLQESRAVRPFIEFLGQKAYFVKQ